MNPATCDDLAALVVLLGSARIVPRTGPPGASGCACMPSEAAGGSPVDDVRGARWENNYTAPSGIVGRWSQPPRKDPFPKTADEEYGRQAVIARPLDRSAFGLVLEASVSVEVLSRLAAVILALAVVAVEAAEVSLWVVQTDPTPPHSDQRSPPI